MALRFGKSREQLNELIPTRISYQEKEEYSFPKHACIQLSISQTGLSIGLFHAVRNNAWDRAYILGRIGKEKSFMKKFVELLKELIGHGFEWTLYDPQNQVGKSFSLDERSLDDFPGFYLEDEEGYESFLKTIYAANDKDINTEGAIVNTLEYYMRLLKPLYELMVQVP